jgi:hypothetical protein
MLDISSDPAGRHHQHGHPHHHYGADAGEYIGIPVDLPTALLLSVVASLCAPVLPACGPLPALIPPAVFKSGSSRLIKVVIPIRKAMTPDRVELLHRRCSCRLMAETSTKNALRD